MQHLGIQDDNRNRRYGALEYRLPGMLGRWPLDDKPWGDFGHTSSCLCSSKLQRYVRSVWLKHSWLVATAELRRNTELRSLFCTLSRPSPTLRVTQAAAPASKCNPKAPET